MFRALKRWDVQVALLLASPIPLSLVLLTTESILHPDDTLPYIAVLWTTIALGAVLTSGVLATKASTVWMFARRHFIPDDSRRLLAAANLIVAAGLCL